MSAPTFDNEGDGSLVVRGVVVMSPCSEFSAEDMRELVRRANSNPPPTTAEDVNQFMRSAAEHLARECGISYAAFRVEYTTGEASPRWDCYVDGGKWQEGDTYAAAHAAQVAAMSPAAMAARLKSETAALMAKARELESGVKS